MDNGCAFWKIFPKVVSDIKKEFEAVSIYLPNLQHQKKHSCCDFEPEVTMNVEACKSESEDSSSEDEIIVLKPRKMVNYLK